MPVLDLTGRETGLQLALDAAPAYELLISLCAFCHPREDVGTLADGAKHDALRAALSPELLAGIDTLGRHAGKMWVNFIGLAEQDPPARTVADLLARLEALTPLELRLYLLGDHVPAYQGSISHDVLRSAARNDRDASTRLLTDRCYFSGEADPTLRPLLALTPEQTRTRALDVLRRWNDEAFAPGEPETDALLQAEARRARQILERETPERAIELVSGVQFVPQPGIQRVVLIPQLAMRPWLLLCEHDTTRLFCYPAQDADQPLASKRLLAMVRALADEKRLKMFEAIARAPSRVAELADRFSLPKSTVYHHLAILRSAGLVRVTSDQDRRYSVRAEALPELADSLGELVGPAPAP